MMRLNEIDAFAKGLIQEIPKVIGGIEIKNICHKSGERDSVTEVDQGLERFLTERILERFPDHQVLGEETYDPSKSYDRGHLWVIDPIDGTTNFVKQRNDYCTIICYFEENVPKLAYIYEVEKDHLYSAMENDRVYLNGVPIEKPEDARLKDKLISTDIRRVYENRRDLFHGLIEGSFGMRSVGTSGLDGSRVISGRFGAYLNQSGGPWDYAPFFLMCDLLGLHFSKLNGEEMELEGYSDYIVSTKRAYEDFAEIRDKIMNRE